MASYCLGWNASQSCLKVNQGLYRHRFWPSFQLNFESKKRRPGPGKDGQNNAKTPILVMFPQKSSNPKRKIFFSILTTRLAESVEGLNSSLAAGDLWPKKGGPIYCLARSLRFKNYWKESSNELMLHRHCL